MNDLQMQLRRPPGPAHFGNLNVELKLWTKSSTISTPFKIHLQCEAAVHMDAEDHAFELVPKLQTRNCEIYRKRPSEKDDVAGANLTTRKELNSMKISQ